MDFLIGSDHDERRHMLHVPRTERPAGADTQWLAFRFRSHGFVSRSPGSHFAIVLRCAVGRDPDGLPQSLSGRGMTLGDTSAAHVPEGDARHGDPQYGGSRGMQVESFWPGGNFLYRDSALFDDGLGESRWYRVRLAVDDARLVTLEAGARRGLWSRRVERARISDRADHPVVPDASGVLIGLGRDRAGETGPWRAEFRDIAFGWSAGGAG